MEWYDDILADLHYFYPYCGILKIDIIRKINTDIRYEPVYRPALYSRSVATC